MKTKFLKECPECKGKGLMLSDEPCERCEGVGLIRMSSDEIQEERDLDRLDDNLQNGIEL